MQKNTVQVLSIAFFITLMIYGFYTLLVYLGTDIHIQVLLSPEQQAALATHCTGGGDYCKGFFALFPFIGYTFERAGPFLWYGILSFVVYLCVLGWQFLIAENRRLVFDLKPWKILLGFIVSLWLIFTVLSYGDSGSDQSVRRMYEPVPQVYVNVGEEGMAELKNNFTKLLDRGCLTYMGQTNNGAGAYNLKEICIQGSFITRVVPQVLFILLIIFEILVFGRFLLSLLRIKTGSLLVESVLSAAIGACGWIVMLWTAAVAHVFYGPVGWGLMIVLPFLLWKHSRYWLRHFLTATWRVEVPWYGVSLFLGWLLVSYLALNFLNVVRPFPIGWDDLGSYLNRPRMMVSYGHFVFSMAPFQWEYLTSLGFLLFGFNSTFGATASMMINWMAGLLAVMTVFTFTNVFLGRGRGLLAALAYYTLPLVGHFSYADMKIDNAVFAMGALSLFALFIALFPPEEEQQTPTHRWLLLTGIFCGFAFAVKSTSIMVIMAVGAVLLGASLYWSAFVGAVFLILLVLSIYGVLDIAGILERAFGTTSGEPFLQLLFAVIGFGTLGLALYRDRQKLPEFGKGLSMMALGFVVCIAPWIIHNNIQQGNIIPRLELGAPNTLSPTMVLSGDIKDANDHGQDIRLMPPELKLDMSNPACTPTGTREELDRYWGFDKGWRHYVALPWRAVMNTNATGYYVTTMPALLLFPLLLLLPYFWTKKGRWLRWMFVATLFIIIQWMFMANGIPWYGVGMFLGLSIGMEALVARSPDLLSRTLAGILIALSIMVCFGNRLWQYDFQKNLFEYSFGKISATAIQERTIPYYDDIADVLTDVKEQNPERPYLYRVGTFIPYFIPKSLEIIGLADHQLDTFNCLYQERDRALTLKRLKALGFSSIIFDTNTATIEQDLKGSLHQKVQSFVDFLNDSSMGWQVLINDPDAGVAFLLIP